MSDSTTLVNEEALSARALTVENRVLLYAGEGAFDETTKASKWRVACVSAPLDPQTGLLPRVGPLSPQERSQWGSSLRFELSDEDFLSLEDFNPEMNCVRQAVNLADTQ